MPKFYFKTSAIKKKEKNEDIPIMNTNSLKTKRDLYIVQPIHMIQ